MKKHLLFLIFISTVQVAKSCVCHPEIFDNYIHADFIGEVKIFKVYKNQSPDYHYYRIDVESSTVYKGEKQEILYVYGSSIENNWSSCDLLVKENENWLVYATKAANGNFEFGLCTKSHKSNLSLYDSLALGKQGLKNVNNDRKRELNFLLELKKHKNVFDKQYVFHNSPSNIPKMYEYLQTFKGQTFKNDLGLYKIVFTKDYSVKKVIIVKSFGRSFDKNLVDFIKKQDFTYLKRLKKPNPTDSYMPLLIQYYPEEIFISYNLL